MDIAQILLMACQVIGGLGLFILGMKHMSEGLQNVAGDRLRHMIGYATNNRFMAIGVGTGITCLVQSSSVTTVMVIGFVNAGFMTLTQAIGVIMGANIGTTITGWMLALKIGKYGLPLLGVSALIYRFTRSDRWRFLAMAAMGIGMVFFGLELMKDGFKPIRLMEDFEGMFSYFAADSYAGVLKCAAVGCVLTMIVQSSSATLGITIGLATTGVIPFSTAAALVLGENIGTTITAFLASIGATTNAKRAAYAHVIFNVIGVVWITAVFTPYIAFVKQFMGVNPDYIVVKGGAETYPYMIAAIAAVHTGFNVTNTAIFLPFTQWAAKLLMRLVPDKAYKEPPRLTHLDVRMLETPVIGIEQSCSEILEMGSRARKMMFRLRAVLTSDRTDEKAVRKIFHGEEVLDIMQNELVGFLTQLLSGRLTHEAADEGRRILRMADEYESVSDYIANILKLHLRLKDANLKFSAAEQAGMMELHTQVAEFLELVNDGCRERHPEIISKAHTHGPAITYKARQLRSAHLADMAASQANPTMSMIYTDMLNAYRRVKDHTLNVAEALAGEK